MITRQRALELGISETNNGKLFQYIEFQSAMIKLAKFVNSNHLSVRQAFTKLATSITLFKQQSDNIYEVEVDWPHHSGMRRIIFRCVFNYDSLRNRGEYVIRVLHKKVCFLELSSSGNELVANIFAKKVSKSWHDDDIYELIDNINEVLYARKLIIKKKQTLASIVELIGKNNHLTKTSLDALIQQYKTYSILYRINHVIIPYSTVQQHRYLMHLDWPDQQNQLHKLVVRFSKSDYFHESMAGYRGYSWVLSEKTLLSHFPEYKAHNIQLGQYYYGLSVYEVTKKERSEKEEETSVLNIWLSNDGNYGELHDVHRGKELSGNDVLDIYRCFDQLFQVKHTFFCDVSSLYNDNRSIRVPLRLILAIMNDKTWYQSKLPGVTLFECTDFPTVANGKITQHNAARNQALQELQAMSLRRWYGMLDKDEQALLLEIYHEIYPSHATKTMRRTRASAAAFDKLMQELDEVTLKNFTATIYNTSKKSGSMSYGLIVLSKLLCGTTDVDYQPITLDPKLPDYWFKHRVNVLLNDSLFWVKENEHSHSRLSRD